MQKYLNSEFNLQKPPFKQTFPIPQKSTLDHFVFKFWYFVNGKIVADASVLLGTL